MTSEKGLYLMSKLYQKWCNKNTELYNLDLRKILVVKWDEIGDMATALHVFELIKGSHPQAEIHLLCKPFVNPLVASNPFIDKIFLNHNNIEKDYDTIVELRGTGESLKKSIKISPKVYLGRGAVRYRNKGNQKHETVTNYEIIQPILKPGKPPISPKIYLSNAENKEIEDFIKTNKIATFTIMHTLARAVLRQWPIERFAQIAHFLNTQYHHSIVLACAPEEVELLTEKLALFPQNTFIYSGINGLLSFAALCQKANLFIGNESGPMQIAATFSNLPLIALYGPGVPTVFYPIGANKKVLHYVLDCNPCDQIHCVQPENRCIDMITVLEVREMVGVLLD